MRERATKYWSGAGAAGSVSGMDWSSRFTEAARSTRRSAVRELLRVTAMRGVISFAGGLPAPELFPVEEVREACARVLGCSCGEGALQYGESEGMPELRAWIAAWESRDGVVVDPEQVLITQGAQQALDLVGRCFLESGRVAAVEDPTYLALLTAWRAQGATLAAYVPWALTNDWDHPWGAIGSESRPICLYAQPNFQNPTGRTWSVDERWRVVGAARRAGVVVVEDDPYGELRFEGEAVPSLYALDACESGGRGDRGNVIRVGTFSKVLAPGLRLGWVVAPEPVIARMVAVRQAMDLHPGSLAQAVTLELVRGGILDRQIPRLRRVYAERARVMFDTLMAAGIPGMTCERPSGGMFLWVGVPGGEGAEKILERGLKAGVAFVPGTEFQLVGGWSNMLRLNYSHADVGSIGEGVRRLVQEIRAGSLTLSAAGA